MEWNMAYKTVDLEKKSLEVIEKHKLFFIEDVVAFLPCTKPTFYEHKLNESNAIKEALEKNKVEIKTSMRSKWYKSENPTLQMGLYKLIGTPEEAERLGTTLKHLGNVDIGITFNETRTYDTNEETN
jgi:hypothetical protein